MIWCKDPLAVFLTLCERGGCPETPAIKTCGSGIGFRFEGGVMRARVVALALRTKEVTVAGKGVWMSLISNGES